MFDKSTVIDFAFKQGTGIDIRVAFKLLLEKGITLEYMDAITRKLLDSIINSIEKEEKDIDDHYMVLFHLVISYLIFMNSFKAYDSWIKSVAAEHNMKPDKYAKIIYSLQKK